MYIFKRGHDNCEYVMTAQLDYQQMIESVNYDIVWDTNSPTDWMPSHKPTELYSVYPT